jgi:ubiquinone/menaquinone biosynthesis C-methylase UbiE
MPREGHRFFAWGFDRLGRRADAHGTEARRLALLAPAGGLVVEVGAGTGLNLARYPPAVTSVVAVEPDPHMLKRLRGVAREAPVPTEVVRGRAERLPIRTGVVDTLVASLVLCSVTDPGAALAEATRVLAPGGRLLFFEHVRSEDPRFARRQDLVERPWGWVGGGCHPNRDTLASIRAAGFAIEELERWDEPGAMFAKPHVLGVAIPPR